MIRLGILQISIAWFVEKSKVHARKVFLACMNEDFKRLLKFLDLGF